MIETAATPLIMTVPRDRESAVLRVVPSAPDDRSAVRNLILDSGVFSSSDANCVDEMFLESLRQPSDDNYRFLSCWDLSAPLSPRMIGFACCGREALTKGAWDLFWICVDRAARGKGAGGMLLTEAQRLAIQDGARLMVIYTSSSDIYAPARRLYESQRFTRVAVVPDYYADGDDLFIYTKRLK
ncbi:MAG: GNAT family N-acetyltransferase [Candidatus Roseilinea sp.]|uniref:GNAT family N-acetyltransferase n=1 Tax=Candidatus Roseilinea sp. TaxID=2838777 RepID=UPI00404AEB8F